MQELIEKVDKTKKWMNATFHMLDTFDTELDIEEAGVNLEKLEKRIANLRKEWEIEYSYLEKETQNENTYEENK
jgi:hypothetical protein